MIRDNITHQMCLYAGVEHAALDAEGLAKAINAYDVLESEVPALELIAADHSCEKSSPKELHTSYSFFLDGFDDYYGFERPVRDHVFPKYAVQLLASIVLGECSAKIARERKKEIVEEMDVGEEYIDEFLYKIRHTLFIKEDVLLSRAENSGLRFDLSRRYIANLEYCKSVFKGKRNNYETSSLGISESSARLNVTEHLLLKGNSDDAEVGEFVEAFENAVKYTINDGHIALYTRIYALATRAMRLMDEHQPKGFPKFIKRITAARNSIRKIDEYNINPAARKKKFPSRLPKKRSQKKRVKKKRADNRRNRR